MIHLRVGRRSTSWASDSSIRDILEMEFQEGRDLQPSFYMVNDCDTEVSQSALEHQALSGCCPSVRPGVDLSNLAETIRQSDGGGPFAFTRKRHHEALFRSGEELEKAIGKLKAEINARLRQTSKESMRKHVAERIKERDPEWLTFFAGTEKKGAWLAFLKIGEEELMPKMDRTGETQVS